MDIEEEILLNYRKNKKKIRKRLMEFSKFKNTNPEKKFLELCFCICTPQSQAKKVAEVINEQNIDVIINGSREIIEEKLRSKTRFHKNKARYIVDARKHISNLNKLHEDTSIARAWLVDNIKGLGYKEASHFLRNIGYRDICIIDRHVIHVLHLAKVFDENRPPKNPKEYLLMEEKIKDFAKKLNIGIDELDLTLWSMRTGFVFK
ncbi:MAG: N-glycosylase [Candidatus Woesearchaeota archaeon]|nr:MAG: N-glycosylase [Candidatus Woesearchaeota archaeon]